MAARIVSETSAPIRITLQAVGGNGGGTNTFNVPASARGGDGGEARARVAEAISTGGGSVDVSVELRGGHGGVGSLQAGSGASVALLDVARGMTTGDLALTQRAFAGNSGGFGFGGTTGVAGSVGHASSGFDVTTSSRSLSLVSEATGGIGNATSGGSASSIVRARNDAGGIQVRTAATGGANGSSTDPSLFGGRARIEVDAQTSGDGQDVLIGGAGLSGALGGANRGEAASHSIGTALGASSVEVWDRAVGGAGLAGSGLTPAAGNASSRAQATSAGGARSVANAFAAGGAVPSAGGSAMVPGGDANAHAAAIGGIDSFARAEARVGRFGSSVSLGNLASTGHALAESAGVATTRAEASSLGRTGRIGTSTAFDTLALASSAGAGGPGSLAAETHAGGNGRQAFASQAHAASAISGAHGLPGEWGRMSLALDRDGFDGGDIVLQAAGSLTNTNRRLPVTTFEGVYVSFLELDFDDDLGAGLSFRVESGGTVLIDRAFENATAARAFFSGVLDLGALTNRQTLSTIDLRFTLGLSNGSNGGRAATYLLVGTTIVPEPGTATLIGFGLLVLAVRRSRR